MADRMKEAEAGTVGHRLAVAMRYRDYSIKRLCGDTGIGKGTVEQLLRNDISGHLYTWAMIAEVLEVSLDWLVFGDGEEE